MVIFRFLLFNWNINLFLLGTFGWPIGNLKAILMKWCWAEILNCENTRLQRKNVPVFNNHPSWRFSLLFVKIFIRFSVILLKVSKNPCFIWHHGRRLALTSSLVSIVVAFGRLLWLNYHYCRIFGCFSSGWEISSCCVWTNTVFAYFGLAVMFYFFFGQFLPKISTYKVHQAKRAKEGSQNIVPIVKNFMFEINDVYRPFSKSQSRTRKEKKPCFVEFIRAIS